MADAALMARVIAFYLPQFHPTADNDRWWGTGHTEWTDVASSVPLFRGHRQPRVPTELGHYDLRCAESRDAQARLAALHGIESFCYWHYWSGGRRLLERPFAEVRASGEPELGFCLAWANESWRRTWFDGSRSPAVLMEQVHPEGDDEAHARWLVEAFADPRYTTIGSRPLFVVYRPAHLPDARRFCDILRRTATEAGLPEPYLVGGDGQCPGVDCRTLGFDATLSFQPQLGVLPGGTGDAGSARRLARNLRLGVPSTAPSLYPEAAARARFAAARAANPHPTIPTVLVGWDNTPRRGSHGLVLVPPSPAHSGFAGAMAQAVAEVRDQPAAERLVFVNAWNEWGEGNYLEPDLASGRAYLDALAAAVGAGTPPTAPAAPTAATASASTAIA